MARTLFACPECGENLTAPEVSVGREVRCLGCGAPVEVPFLVRGFEGKLRRGSADPMPLLLRIAWGLTAVMALVVAGGGISRILKVRVASERAQRIEDLVASAKQKEQSGKLETALVEAEAALALQRSTVPGDPRRLADLNALRDRISGAEARERLAEIDKLDPKRAAADALTLRARAERDPALADLADAIDEALERSRLRQFDQELATARSATDSGRAVEALALLEGLFEISQKLSPQARRATDLRLTAEAERLVGLHGINLVPTDGTFVGGSTASYDSALRPGFLDAVKARGYLSRPAKSPFVGLWDKVAPYRLGLDVVETLTGYYLQSKSQVTEIRGIIRLMRGSATVWVADFTGRTRVPVEGLPAYIASRLAVSDKRDAEAEKRLYEDAFAAFSTQCGIKIRGLPGPVRP